jgi:hypothetical protein
MKRLGALASAAALAGALAMSSPALAFGGHGGFGGGGFHGGGFGGGWHGGGWRGGYGGWGWGLGAGLVGLGLGYGLASGWDYPYDYAYGYPNDYYGYPGYAYAPGYYTTAPRVATTAPLVTGRSVAEGVGDFCTTPVKKCELYHPSNLGAGCSCRVPGGRASGSVTP